MPGRSVPPRAAPLVDPSIEALWAHVLDHWQDEKAHAAFLQQCDHLNQLAGARATCRWMAGYRTPAQVAEMSLTAVADLAMDELESHRALLSEVLPVLDTVLALLLVGADVLAVAYAYSAF